ncbi:dynamin family protein [Corynebacterium uterequi]|uniref:Dynamin family protein n=2 Tax=Corynebacterium uterequi TaxID=1072256 RepID=A0A0G3HAK7_9CORY|nr:dynamin family protein [Corynebacterium uterequi]
MRLRDGVDGVRLPLAPDAADEARAVVAQLDDYLLPRLHNLDAPLLAVVGGSTGAGKSALVNSVVGDHVTTSGVTRPTTRQPVLITHPDNEAWFSSPHVLPGLAREVGAAADPQASTLRVVTTSAIAPGLALLDAPDFDSIDAGNRQLAAQLLAAADLWVFVTTPARYADQLVWNFLHDAAARNIEVIVVLNRVDASAAASVPQDLRRMMTEAGLGEAPLITVAFDAEFTGLLPGTEQLKAHLQGLATDAAARRATAGRTAVGALRQLSRRVDSLAETRAEHEALAAELDASITALFDAAADSVIDATSDGKLLRTEVLSRWQDFVGTSDAARTLERWYSLAVDKIGAFFGGRPEPVREVATEIEQGLHTVIVDAGETAARRSVALLGAQAPRLREDGAAALAAGSPELPARAAELVRQWQAGLVAHIQDSAAGKRQRARFLSLGLNVLTVALMLVVFASSAGLTGAEFAIAGGSAVVGQKLLETVFGEEAVRRMARAAREDLENRVRELFAEEQARYTHVVEPLRLGTTAEELRQAAAASLADAHALLEDRDV